MSIRMLHADVESVKADLVKGEIRITFSLALDSVASDQSRRLAEWADDKSPVDLLIDKARNVPAKGQLALPMGELPEPVTVEAAYRETASGDVPQPPDGSAARSAAYREELDRHFAPAMVGKGQSDAELIPHL